MSRREPQAVPQGEPPAEVGHRRTTSEGRSSRLAALAGARWRTVVFVVITLWLCIAIAVVFFRGLGDAERSGAAEQVAAQYQRYLGPGWFPLEVDPLPPAPGETGPTWLGLNYSSGEVSTIRPSPTWRTLRLRIAPIGCPNGRPLSVEVSQGAASVGSLAMAPGWAWYSFRLAGSGRPVRLHYSCVTIEQAPGRGLQTARRIAILLSGVEG